MKDPKTEFHCFEQMLLPHLNGTSYLRAITARQELALACVSDIKDWLQPVQAQQTSCAVQGKACAKQLFLLHSDCWRSHFRPQNRTLTSVTSFYLAL